MSQQKRLDNITFLKGQLHKTGVNSDDWYNVHSNLIVLALFTVEFASKHNLPLVFTSIIRPKIKGVSKTDIHAKGRAFDIRTEGWTLKEINLFVDEINSKFNIGAISITDGKEREAVYEDGITAGKGAHLHVQCRN